MSNTIYRLGGETRVNATNPFVQSMGCSAPLPDGGWLSVWSSNGQDGFAGGIYLRRFHKDGAPVDAADRLVNITTADSQASPSVAVMPDGGWVVVWATSGTSGTRIHQQRFTQAGVAVATSDMPVNASPASKVWHPKVAALSDGGWVVTWEDGSQDKSSLGVYQQRFDKDGVAASTAEKRVNVVTKAEQSHAVVTGLKDGGWVVSWMSLMQDGAAGGIYQQRFNKDGIASSPVDLAVNVTKASNQAMPSVAALKDGGWVVAWESFNQDGSWSGVYQQRFKPDGTAASGVDLLVNKTTAGDQESPSVAALPDGGWILTWQSWDGVERENIYCQRFDQNGVATSPVDIVVNTTKAGLQCEPDVVVLSDGSWVVQWTSYEEGTLNADIYQQHFSPALAPTRMSLSQTPVDEAARNGTKVGSLEASDPDLAGGDRLFYELLDNAGGRFALTGNTLLVADGLRLDHEQAADHAVRVRVTDQDGLSLDRELKIHVGDVAAEKVSGDAQANVLVGGTGADLFWGREGDDRLSGGGGQDRLYGGGGRDLLAGGEGKDVFVFDVAPDRLKTGLDRVTDFSARDDAVWLDNAVFGTLGRKGSEQKPAPLKSQYFTVGKKAHDADDHIIFNRKKGVLLYDADGAGGKGAVQIATFDKIKGKMALKDFFVV